jgi:hypothetical protein
LLTNLGVPVALERSGLVFSSSLSLRIWERVGQELRAISDSSAWWLADWLIYGETAYTGRYREAIERTGLDYQTLRNYAWVARRFDLPRRRDNLSFAHHAEVASLAQPEQDYWLRRAEEQGWSRNNLRKEVRASLAERRGESLAETNNSGSGRMVTADRSVEAARAIQIQLSAEQLERCEKAAVSCGLSLNDWAAYVLESAIGGYEKSGHRKLGS